MARDKFHPLVRTLLEADGWVITHDPFVLKLGSRRYEVDMGAERIIAAERGVEQILVEVKSFLSHSIVHEMHEVVGQYGNYRRILKLKKDGRPLLLALPRDAYEMLFTDEFGMLTAEEEDIKFLIFEPNAKKLLEWKR